jgi:GWxTD domain-containing protein
MIKRQRLFPKLRWCVVLAVATIAPRMPAQVEVPQPQGNAFPTFYFDAISYISEHPEKSRIDVYIQVPYEELRFIKEEDQFIARYDITLSIYTPAKQLVHERTWTEVVRVSDPLKTSSSRMYSLSHRVVDVEPGNYQAHVEFHERDSRNTARAFRSMLVTDYAKDPVALSDIMLVSKLSIEGDRKNVIPNISGNVGYLTDGFYLFFEIYSNEPLDSLQLVMKIFDAKKKEILQQSSVEQISGTMTQSFMKVDPLQLPSGMYFVTVDAHRLRDVHPDTSLAQTSRTFFVRLIDLPSTIQDIDKAVDQMRYVALPSEMEYILNGSDPEEKQRRFLAFWKKRDPEPATQRNELLEEYYARVEYANKTFAHYNDGWKSDRGMVYIHLGPPDQVERRPFDMNSKPYEIWYYYNLNRDLVFIDETGFGDYRLRSPMVDFLGRIR